MSVGRSGLVTSASIEIRLNQPPVLGNFSVHPTSGSTLETVFYFSSTGWEDTDLPLSFSFGYTTQTELPNLLRRKVKPSFLLSVLPRGRGLHEDTDSLQCLNYVHDFLGAVTSKYAAVTVYDSTQETSFLGSTSDLFAASLGSVEETQATILLVSSTMNYVNCSKAPDCASLFREECSKVEHTCGACLEGTSGDGGELNAKCLTANDFDDFLNYADTTRMCIADSDCHGWEECVEGEVEAASGVCQRALKTCQNECNGHGRCTFLQISSGRNLSTCVVGASACEARCICSDGFTGDHCTVSPHEATLGRNVTLLLLQKTKETLSTEEHDMDSVMSLLIMLEAVVKSPYLLTRKSIQLAFDILELIFALLLDYDDVSTEKLVRVSNIFDILLKSLSSQLRNSAVICPDPFVDVFVSLFSQFESIISQSLIPGQYSFSIITDLLRSTTQPQDPVIQNMTLSVPLSELETKVNLKPSDFLSDSVFSYSVFSVAAKLYGECGADFTANPTKFSLDTNLHSNGDNVSFLLTSELTNNVVVDYPVAPTDKLLTTKCVASDFSEYSYTCPIQIPVSSPYASSDNITVTHQCKGVAEIIQTNCPVVSLQSQCVVLDSALDIICEPTLYTTEFTSCSCRSVASSLDNASQTRASPSIIRRQLQNSNVEESFLLVTKPLIVVEEVTVTTAGIEYVPKKASSLAALSFLLSFFILCGLCLVSSIRTSRRELKQIAAEDLKKKQMLKGEEDSDEKALMKLFKKPPMKSSLQKSARKEVIAYMKSILPFIFQSRIAVMERLYVEFYRNHRYLTPKAIHEKHSQFCQEGGDMCRVAWVAQLLVVQAVVFLCFVLLHMKQVRDMPYGTDVLADVLTLLGVCVCVVFLSSIRLMMVRVQCTRQRKLVKVSNLFSTQIKTYAHGTRQQQKWRRCVTTSRASTSTQRPLFR